MSALSHTRSAHEAPLRYVAAEAMDVEISKLNPSEHGTYPLLNSEGKKDNDGKFERMMLDFTHTTSGTYFV